MCLCTQQLDKLQFVVRVVKLHMVYICNGENEESNMSKLVLDAYLLVICGSDYYLRDGKALYCIICLLHFSQTVELVDVRLQMWEVKIELCCCGDG